VNGEEWRNMRVVINPIFGKLSMFVGPMNSKIEELMGRIEEQVQENKSKGIESFSIGEDIQRMTLDVLGVCILGEDVKFLKGEK